jgi:glycosyltransferase involved in cell wall biosynthesis
MYVKPENVEELVSAISFLSSNKDFLKNASKKARRFIEENFDRVKISQNFLNLVENCFKAL